MEDEREHAMVLTLPPQLESVLAEQARRQGISPEALALELLTRQLLAVSAPTPRDEWEQELLKAAVDCGVSIPDAVLSSEGLYE